MSKIKKIDFYCGAFLSYLISNGIEPTLFDAGEKSKIVNFTLRDKDYNAYLKYVSTSIKSTISGKEYTKWDILFTDKENKLLTTKFKIDNRENIVILVCSCENLKNTCLAILSLDDALTCLGSDTKNDKRRITVKHKKGSKYLQCYGTALPDINALKLKYNLDEYFRF